MVLHRGLGRAVAVALLLALGRTVSALLGLAVLLVVIVVVTVVVLTLALWWSVALLGKGVRSTLYSGIFMMGICVL